eukprot:g27758.t1
MVAFLSDEKDLSQTGLVALQSILYSKFKINRVPLSISTRNGERVSCVGCCIWQPSLVSIDFIPWQQSKGWAAATAGHMRNGGCGFSQQIRSEYGLLAFGACGSDGEDVLPAFGACSSDGEDVLLVFGACGSDGEDV